MKGGKKNKKEEIVPFRVKKIVFHEYPDLDCIGCYFLAMTYSQIGFLDIEKAKIEFWPQGPPPDGRTAEEHEKEGTICFDVGEGRFDHHPHGQNGKPFDKCATDLVAEFLKVSDEPSLLRILDYIRMQDLEGPSSLSRSLREEGVQEDLIRKASLLEETSLASWLNGLRLQKSNWQVLKMGFDRLVSMHRQQLYFWNLVKEEFQKKARIWRTSSNSKSYKVATIESDVHEVGAFSRTKQGGYCDICIQKEPKTGYVFISGKVSSEEFIEIAKILRVKELKARGITNEPYTLSDLLESRFRLSPIWYLPKNKYGKVFVIVNGGPKANNIEPTALPLGVIESAVLLGLNDQIMPKTCPQTSCLFEDCSFFPFFLNRCLQIREKQQ